MLFSEFVFDLPEALPESLADVPRAPDAARPLVEDLCERLRNDNRTQADYIDRAESIENELELQSRCRSLKDLGRRDTFPFEERTFFSNAINALIQDEMDTVRAILSKRVHSVWCGKGESQAQWDLLRSALSLYETCDDLERQQPAYTRSFDGLIDFYINVQREADRLQREFEQAVIGIFDTQVMDDVIDKVRSKYRCLSAKSHDYFIRQLESNGWPPIGRSYESIIGPYLKGAKEITIEDPYIRLKHQIQNFVRFCEAVIKLSSIRKINLITSYDDKITVSEMRDSLDEVKQSLLEIDVELDIDYNL